MESLRKELERRVAAGIARLAAAAAERDDMKAMVLKAKNTPFVLETVPDPVPGPGEAVARVLACGAGLTIHHTRAGRVPVEYPRIIGHEITGEIVAIGQRRHRR